MKILIICVLLFSGCCVDKQLVETTEANWNAVAPEYLEYVKDDETLTTDEKQMRITTVKMFYEALEEYKEIAE